MTEDTKKGIDERYQSATHASSLVVVAERGGPGDMLVAAGWSKSRVGAALMRVHSEWDGAEKPPRMHERAIRILAGAIALEELAAAGKKPARGDEPPKVTEHHVTQARLQAAEWLLHEQKILLGKLKTLPYVRGELIDWAMKSGMHAPQTAVAQVLGWWLNPTCPVCSGRRWEVIPGTPKLSRKPCQTCKGTGERGLPGGMEGAALLGYVKDCVNASRVSMKRSLQNFKPKGE